VLKFKRKFRRQKVKQWVPVFPGLNRQERGVDHPIPSSAEVKERVEIYLYPPPPRAFVACSRVNLAFTFTFHISKFS